MQVHLLVRGDKLRASKAMQDRTTSSKAITVHYNMAVEDAYGENLLAGLHVYNTKTGRSFADPINKAIWL